MISGSREIPAQLLKTFDKILDTLVKNCDTQVRGRYEIFILQIKSRHERKSEIEQALTN